ncbi:MAG: hypothetical protein WAS24_09420 [Thermoplasmata archaeon]
MKNRILSIALALSLLAMVFAALPTSAQVSYTGSVETTDDTGNLVDTYVQGLPVYVIVEVKYQGVWADVPITVRLETSAGTPVGGAGASFNTNSNDPAVGWYNSTTAAGHLTLSTAGAVIANDLTSLYVVVYHYGQEISRTTIIVKKEALTLDPPNAMSPYYPGQTVTAKLVTTYTTYMFYVETVNETDVTMPNMNWTALIAPDGWWEHSFTLASSFPDGTYRMRVRDSTTNDIWYQQTFNVQKYVFDVSTSRYVYLPGETAMIQYMTMNVATFTEETGVTITYSAMWYNSSGNATWQNATLAGASGTQQFLIPTDVAMWQNVEISYWANESGRSASAGITLYFAMIDGQVAVALTSYVPGDTVVVTVSANLDMDVLPGAAVDISVLVNGTAIEAYGSTNLTTNLQGEVTHTFKLVDAAAKGTYVVSAEISKVGFSTTVIGMFSVTVGGSISVLLDKGYYYGGDTMTATITPIWDGKVVSVDNLGYSFTLDTGLLAWGNTSQTTVTAVLPTDYSGNVLLGVQAFYNGHMISGLDTATVHLADIALTVQNDRYRPGETVVFDWKITTGLATGSLQYEIVDSNGVKVKSEAPTYSTTGTFSQDVPLVNPPSSYTAHMWMTTETGGFAQASLTVSMMANHELKIWVDKSKYSNGMYKPGETVKLHYSIGEYTMAPLETYRLYVYSSYNAVGTYYIVTDTTGYIEFAIPSDAPSAPFGIYAYLYDPATPGPALSSDSTAITVSTQLTGWDRSVAGMSAINFTILVLLIIMILLLIVMPFLKGRMGAPKTPEPVKVEPPPPTP